jgi:hypothetical protein
MSAERIFENLDYLESVSIEKDFDLKYIEFVYYYSKWFGPDRDLQCYYKYGVATTPRFFGPTPASDGFVRLYIPMGPSNSTIYTQQIEYFDGMKWQMTIDADNSEVIIVNPLGNTEIYEIEPNDVPYYIVRLDSDDYCKGSFLINNYGPGSPWEYDFSDEDGGDGDADDTTDEISTPSLPTISALTSSMVKMYNPTITELTSLAGFLWSASFVDNVVKLFQDPMEAILGLSMVYITPTTGTSEVMTIGKVSSGVNALPVSNQFTSLDCGTIEITEYWGNALDYDPHTKLQIYLPYIGIQTLSIDDFMKGSINVSYNIDLLTGACMCFITAIRDSLNSVLYSFSGNISAQVPLSGSDMSSVISSIIGVAASAGLTYASGGSSAPLVAGSAMSMLNAKTHIQKSGRLDASVGVLGIKTPYLILTRPVQSLAENYNSYRGYPSNITTLLGDLTGYTEVDTIYMKGITATQEEIEIIESSLKGGVIL